jgi:cell division protein ZapA (FtsZ GTPase activity inhibitor)
MSEIELKVKTFKSEGVKILDLINRQQKEIEVLREGLKELSSNDVTVIYGANTMFDIAKETLQKADKIRGRYE